MLSPVCNQFTMKDYITRAQFSRLHKYFSVKTGRPRTYDIFDIVNAIYHILITGSQWRNLPNSYPPYRIVFYHFSRWKRSKVFHSLLVSLLTKKQPRVLVIDNQSISDSDLPSGKAKGFDGHKHRKGRKRCILTDHEGLIHCIKYFPANTHDTLCAKSIIEYYRLTPFGKYNSKVVTLLGDKGFHSPGVKEWAKKHRIQYQPIPRLKKPDVTKKVGWELWKDQYGCIIEKNRAIRWVVERTFAWLQKYRRLNMNYERTVSSLEVMTLLAGIRMILQKG